MDVSRTNFFVSNSSLRGASAASTSVARGGHTANPWSESNYHQASAFTKRPLTADDYQTALAFANTGKVPTNFFSSQPTGKVNAHQAIDGGYASRGALWEGFSVPANNGTGELKPTISSKLDLTA